MFRKVLLASTVVLGFPAICYAQNEGISAQEMEKIYEKASEDFQGNKVHNPVDVLDAPSTVGEKNIVDVDLGQDESSEFARSDVEIIPDTATFATISEPEGGYIPLGNITMTVNIENESVRQVVDTVVRMASEKAGPWQVKWRLRRQNDFLLSEKVNITAETTFEQFLEYLVDRINNLTGIQLFVTRFDGSRILIISDTYY